MMTSLKIIMIIEGTLNKLFMLLYINNFNVIFA